MKEMKSALPPTVENHISGDGLRQRQTDAYVRMDSERATSLPPGPMKPMPIVTSAPSSNGQSRSADRNEACLLM
jgi:hypothetical protein